jgi:hypothetical protein
MFIEPVASDFDLFPEEKFDVLVSQGKLVKRVAIEKSAHGSEPDIPNPLCSSRRRMAHRSLSARSAFV